MHASRAHKRGHGWRHENWESSAHRWHMSRKNMGTGIEGNKREPKTEIWVLPMFRNQLEKAASVKRGADEIRYNPGEGRIMKLKRRKHLKRKSLHLWEIP